MSKENEDIVHNEKDTSFVVTSFRLPTVLVEQLKQSSKKHDLHMAQIVRKAIKREIEKLDLNN